MAKLKTRPRSNRNPVSRGSGPSTSGGEQPAQSTDQVLRGLARDLPAKRPSGVIPQGGRPLEELVPQHNPAPRPGPPEQRARVLRRRGR